jgi:protein CpxP
MKKLISVILLSACITGSAFAGAHNGDRQGGHRGEGPMPLHKLAKVLDLSDSQIEQFKLLKQESKDLRVQGKRENSVMSKATELDPNANDYLDSLNALADQRAAQARERFLSMAEQRIKMREILTPEQLVKLNSLQEKREKRQRHGQAES